MHGKTNAFLLLVSLAITMTVITGCMGLTKDPGATPEVSSASFVSTGSAVSTFQTTFYAFATTNCVQCHGSNQSPLFAVSDVNAAYTNAKPFADFTTPSESMLVQYASNGHCGIPNCSGSTQGAAALAAVTTWASAELSLGNAGSTGTGSTGSTVTLAPPASTITYYTTPVPIPSLPPAGNTYAIMRWSLSSLTPTDSDVSGGIFELQIQQLTSSTYKVAQPKLALPTNAINVTGIHVLVKKSSDSGNGQESPLALDWAGITATVTPTTIPSPLPKTTLSVGTLTQDTMPIPVLSSSDELVIGFDVLAPASTGCENLSGTNGFVATVLPTMTSTCFTCHLSGANAQAFAAFPMVNNNNAALCATTLEHIDTANPSLSQIYENPQGENGHPNVLPSPPPFLPWIMTE